MSALETQVGGSHYKDMKIQPMEFALANNLNAVQFNVLRYICRHKAKTGRQDVEKAIHCMELALELKPSFRSGQEVIAFSDFVSKNEIRKREYKILYLICCGCHYNCECLQDAIAEAKLLLEEQYPLQGEH